MKKVLVTGATGVIGSALISRLLKEKDIEITGTYNKNANINPKQLFCCSGKLILRRYRDVLKEDQCYDAIWHFATYGQPARFINNWKDVISLNTQDILRLGELLKDSGKFYYASTSELYGNNDKCTEKTIPASYTCTPRSIYTDSKRLGESILANSMRSNQYMIFRICLAYTEFFRWGDRRVMYELVAKALVDNKIKLIDSGNAIRQYIYVEDAIDMMLRLSLKEGVEMDAQIYNIANPEVITIYKLAECIADYFDVDVIRGEENNPHSALDKVSVIPERFFEISPEYKFTSLSEGVSRVCSEGREMFERDAAYIDQR